MGNRPVEPLARGLYLEIAQVEEQHVTQYKSLLDAAQTWPQKLLWHEYNECWLYHSFMSDGAERAGDRESHGADG